MNSKWLAILLMMASCGAFADTLGVKFGLQHWQADNTGYVGEADDAVLSWSSDSQSQIRIYGSIEHPIFLIPNVKMGYSKFDFEDIALLDQTYRLGGQLYSIASELNYGGEYEIIKATLSEAKIKALEVIETEANADDDESNTVSPAHLELREVLLGLDES